MQPIPLFKLGAVVSRSEDGDEDFGHILGFSRNCTGELILKVRFSRMEEPYLIHPENVRVYE